MRCSDDRVGIQPATLAGGKMEDKHQLLSHGKPPGDNEQGIARGLSCPPDHPITGPPDHRICSPDHPIARSPDSSDCRECLAAMAHRLAQPMTALRGGIELGLMGKHSVADYRSLLEQSLQLADSMAQLIVSLRDLGESGAPGGHPSASSWKRRPRKSWQKWRVWRSPGNSVCNSRPRGQ